MNFSDFKRLLGADPGSRDPEFLRARDSGPEFAEAAAESDRLERRLRQALDVAPPAGLIEDLKRIPRQDAETGSRSGRPLKWFALAASVLLAAVATAVVWRVDPAPTSIESYVAQHFHHDGPMVLERGQGQVAGDVDELLAAFDMSMTEDAAGRVGYIMLCPTPEGVGVHFMVHTESGPVTVIVMPETAVVNGHRFAFDGMQAHLVSLQRGSAAIIAPTGQDLSRMDTFIQNALRSST